MSDPAIRDKLVVWFTALTPTDRQAVCRFHDAGNVELVKALGGSLLGRAHFSDVCGSDCCVYKGDSSPAQQEKGKNGGKKSVVSLSVSGTQIQAPLLLREPEQVRSAAEELLSHVRVGETKTYGDTLLWDSVLMEDGHHVLDILSRATRGRFLSRPCRTFYQAKQRAFVWEAPAWFPAQTSEYGFFSLASYVGYRVEAEMWKHFFNNHPAIECRRPPLTTKRYNHRPGLGSQADALGAMSASWARISLEAKCKVATGLFEKLRTAIDGLLKSSLFSSTSSSSSSSSASASSSSRRASLQAMPNTSSSSSFSSFYPALPWEGTVHAKSRYAWKRRLYGATAVSATKSSSSSTQGFVFMAGQLASFLKQTRTAPADADCVDLPQALYSCPIAVAFAPLHRSMRNHTQWSKLTRWMKSQIDKHEALLAYTAAVLTKLSIKRQEEKSQMIDKALNVFKQGEVALLERELGQSQSHADPLPVPQQSAFKMPAQQSASASKKRKQRNARKKNEQALQQSVASNAGSSERKQARKRSANHNGYDGSKSAQNSPHSRGKKGGLVPATDTLSSGGLRDHQKSVLPTATTTQQQQQHVCQVRTNHSRSVTSMAVRAPTMMHLPPWIVGAALPHTTIFSALADDHHGGEVQLPNPPRHEFQTPHPVHLPVRDHASSLHQEIKIFTAYVSTQVAERAPNLAATLENIKREVQSIWPYANVKTYGSVLTGLCLPGSDLDLVVTNLPAFDGHNGNGGGDKQTQKQDRSKNAQYGGRNGLMNDDLAPGMSRYLVKLAGLLKEKTWVKNMNAIATAKVPVIKLVSVAGMEREREGKTGRGKKRGKENTLAHANADSLREQGIVIDITFDAALDEKVMPRTLYMQPVPGQYRKNCPYSPSKTNPRMRVCPFKCKERPKECLHQSVQHTGLAAAALIQKYMKVLPELRPLALVLKQYLYENHLSDTYTGGLSSFCLVLMIVAYLLSQDEVESMEQEWCLSENERAGNLTDNSSGGTQQGFHTPAKQPEDGKARGSNHHHRPTKIVLSAQKHMNSVSVGSPIAQEPATTASPSPASSVSSNPGPRPRTHPRGLSRDGQGHGYHSPADLGDLLLGIMHFYSNFNFQWRGIQLQQSIYRGYPCFYNLRAYSPTLVISDPFNPLNNIGKSVFAMWRIQQAFAEGYKKIINFQCANGSRRGTILGAIIQGPPSSAA